EYCQVVQGRGYTRDILDRGVWTLGSQRQAGQAINKDKDDRLHDFLLALSETWKKAPLRVVAPHITQGTSLTSPSGRTVGNSRSSSVAAVAAVSAFWGVADVSLSVCSGLSSRRMFPSFSLNRNVCFCPPPLIGSTRKTRPLESVRTKPS